MTLVTICSQTLIQDVDVGYRMSTELERARLLVQESFYCLKTKWDKAQAEREKEEGRRKTVHLQEATNTAWEG